MLQIALQRQHERVAIDDAGAGRVQGTDAGQRGLHLQGFFTAEALEIEHSVGTGARLDAFQAVQLGGRGSHQQLAATAVGHAALRAVGIEHLLSAGFTDSPRRQRLARLGHPSTGLAIERLAIRHRLAAA